MAAATSGGLSAALSYGFESARVTAPGRRHATTGAALKRTRRRALTLARVSMF
jgi:hypothetical protein